MSESNIDWDSAPEWADRIIGMQCFRYWANAKRYAEVGFFKMSNGSTKFQRGMTTIGEFELIEMRPEIKPDSRINIIGQNGNDGEHYEELERNKSKYHREIKSGVFVDVYDVLLAFGVTNPAMQHALKKMLAPGQRGVKDTIQDMKEAIQSIERAIELEQS